MKEFVAEVEDLLDGEMTTRLHAGFNRDGEIATAGRKEEDDGA